MHIYCKIPSTQWFLVIVAKITLSLENSIVSFYFVSFPSGNVHEYFFLFLGACQLLWSSTSVKLHHLQQYHPQQPILPLNAIITQPPSAPPYPRRFPPSHLQPYHHSNFTCSFLLILFFLTLNRSLLKLSSFHPIKFCSSTWLTLFDHPKSVLTPTSASSYSFATFCPHSVFSCPSSTSKPIFSKRVNSIGSFHPHQRRNELDQPGCCCEYCRFIVTS